MQGISIRKATPNDIDEMTAIWLDAMRLHESWDSRCKLKDDAETSFKSYLKKSLQDEKEDTLWLVVESTGGIAGVCEAYIQNIAPPFYPGRKGWLSFVGVKPEFKRTGIGTMILEEYKRWFRSRGISYVELTVVEANATGVRFWENNGFTGFIRRMTMEL